MCSNNCCKFNKIVNRQYISDFYKRYYVKLSKFFTENDFYSYYDKYLIENNGKKNKLDVLFINCDFYKEYEIDLSNYDNNSLINHWNQYGKNEFHRISNPNYITSFGKTSYFVAGTMFACNMAYLKIFEDIDFEYEYNKLENGHSLNDEEKKTH